MYLLLCEFAIALLPLLNCEVSQCLQKLTDGIQGLACLWCWEASAATTFERGGSFIVDFELRMPEPIHVREVHRQVVSHICRETFVGIVSSRVICAHGFAYRRQSGWRENPKEAHLWSMFSACRGNEGVFLTGLLALSSAHRRGWGAVGSQTKRNCTHGVLMCGFLVGFGQLCQNGRLKFHESWQEFLGWIFDLAYPLVSSMAQSRGELA